jgi:diguanylate cyclase (GGDEF)-like protein
LLKDWQLPEAVWTSIRGLIQPDDQPEPEGSNLSGRILRLADAVAAFLVAEEPQNSESIQKLSESAKRDAGIEPEIFRELISGVSEDWISYGRLFSLKTNSMPDLEAIEREAEEHRSALSLASQMEVVGLKSENEQLSELARHDKLTGMLNRAAFDQALPAAVSSARDQARSVALLMIDVDRFKSINDTYGHPAGDSVLKHLAGILDDNARKRDGVYRYGGEEFAVIAPDCSKDGAISLAEGFRSSVEAEPHVEPERTIPLTISVGIAWVDADHLPEDPKDLIEYADQRLYDAKHGGRNTWRIEPAGSEDRATAATGLGRGLLSRLGKLVGGK